MRTSPASEFAQRAVTHVRAFGLHDDADIVARQLRPEHLKNPAYRSIWIAAENAEEYRAGLVTLDTVAEELGPSGLASIGGREFLHELMLDEVVEDALDQHGVQHYVGMLNNGTAHGEEHAPRLLAAPLSVRDLCELPELQEDFLVEPLAPAVSNILLAAYPKSGKTMFMLALALAVALGKPFLGRFAVPRRRRIGLVLMEDRAHRIRRRLRRMCHGLGVELEDLEGWLFTWFRPPQFRLADPRVMGELAQYVEQHGLELLSVDNWTHVAKGNSNDSDEVLPQLNAFRDACGTACSPLLVHHARKTGAEDTDSQRLTDLIRNSGDFGGWYDSGIVLARKNENAPVKVRTELRDDAAPEPFALTVEDEFPRTEQQRASGYLRLVLSDQSPAELERAVAAERFVPAVLRHLEKNPGCSKRSLRSIDGDNALIESAFELLCDRGIARYEEAPTGKAGKCWKS